MSVANRLSDWGLDKLSKGNFAANFGAGTYDDAITLSSDSNNPTKLQEKRKLRGPFSVVSNFGIQPQMVLKATSARDAALRSGWKASRDRGTKLASLRDGDSRTIMVSEVIGYDSSSDGRGVWTNTSMGASIFSAKIPPNADASSREEYMDHTQLCDVHIEKDDPYHMACKRVRESHGRNLYAAARSGHPEGLNVLMCDSSVRYVANTVDPEVWKGVATIAGSENVDLP
jgi:prepilin-type processing-associated H-X9-DG protein